VISLEERREDLKRLVLYPFLFALYVILSPLSGNLDQLDPALALRPLAVLLLAAAAGLLLFYSLFRDWHYAGYLVFLALVFFFMFGHLYRLVQGRLPAEDKDFSALVLLILWGAGLGLLSLKPVWTRLGGRAWMTPFFNLVFGLALLYPGTVVLLDLLNRPTQAQASGSVDLPDTGEAAFDCSSRPDIYLIVMDAYGREDVLAGLYGFDNQPFLDALQDRGFYVAGESYGNYIQTVFSVPAVLNFTEIDPPRAGVNGAEYFRGLVEDNRLMRLLKRCGYRTMAIESGFYFTDHPDVDVFYSRESDLNAFEDLLLSGSPWEVISNRLGLDPPAESYEGHRLRVQYSFRRLESVARQPGPKVVFAHIISPHPPFVFDESGGRTEPGRAYSLADGEDFEGSLAEYRQGYAAQVQFVNRRLEEAIDAILSRSAIPPVILLQGDHGPGSRLNWSSPAGSCLWERTAVLNAVYLPGAGREALYPSISPVNAIRAALNASFDAGLPRLPDRTYFTSYALEGQAIDITAERSSQENCK
jgi:hypothetical protein